MLTSLLVVHGLVAVALLGAITHQIASLFARGVVTDRHFVGRYLGVRYERFAWAVVVLYVLVLGLGATLYPSYRVDVRIPFEEMGLGWAIGLFELKEHAGALGLGLLPLYAYLWQAERARSHARDRRVITALIAAIVWFDFVVGHILNNIRGLA